ncbi:hypothetical protein LENED_008170 [Lentinula edodes]|uniref:Uncharacterized protein n=1 Tax=Lentinula edodes TaxID=5353 RepID=A0A1Q3EGH3_LENED|nr:hypothetical protein LENED_008170 [Lentinula edodes]
MLGLSAPLMTRDDLARRPSRAIMYQSIMPLYSFDSNPANTTPPSTGNTLSSAQWWATDPGSGSPLTTGPYTIAPPGDAPGWDAAPKKPNTWYTWSEGNVGPHAMNPMALCSPNDLNTDFTNLTSQWNYDRVPTFTNPFGAVPSATSTNDISLAWNPDTSFMSRQELMSEAQAHDFTSNAFDSANYLQNDIPRSGAYTVEDLDNLFKTRMSLVENDPGFPEAEQVSKGQPQFYWGAREETNQEGLLPVHYLRDENGLYYHAVNEVHKLNGEGSREPVNTPSNNHSTVYSNNDMSLSHTAVQALKEKVEKEWQRSRVRPSASSSLSSTSSPTGVGPSTTPLPTFRRPMLTAEDLQRLEESAGLRGNERATPENYERLRASITEHYLKKYSELKREARGKVIPKSEEKAEDEVQISLHPHQGDAKRETYYQ